MRKDETKFNEVRSDKRIDLHDDHDQHHRIS